MPKAMLAVRPLSCGVLLTSSLLVAAGFATVSAERLPVRAYSSSDGLGHDRVLCVVQDSHGLLWFCTADGLSRFDGRRFVNYGEAQGLPFGFDYDQVRPPPRTGYLSSQKAAAQPSASQSVLLRPTPVAVTDEGFSG